MVIYLHYIMELSYGEISWEIDVSEQVLAQRLARARLKLATGFLEKWGDGMNQSEQQEQLDGYNEVDRLISSTVRKAYDDIPLLPENEDAWLQMQVRLARVRKKRQTRRAYCQWLAVASIIFVLVNTKVTPAA